MEVVDDFACVADTVVKEGAFGRVAVHGDGVIHIEGDQVAALGVQRVGGDVGLGEGDDEGGDGQNAQAQDDKVLQLRLPLRLLGDVLQHLHIGEIVRFVPPEIEKVDEYGHQNGHKADKKQRLVEKHSGLI